MQINMHILDLHVYKRFKIFHFAFKPNLNSLSLMCDKTYLTNIIWTTFNPGYPSIIMFCYDFLILHIKDFSLKWAQVSIF